MIGPIDGNGISNMFNINKIESDKEKKEVDQPTQTTQMEAKEDEVEITSKVKINNVEASKNKINDMEDAGKVLKEVLGNIEKSDVFKAQANLTPENILDLVA